MSFTFDDFPSSAVHAGGTLITELGGTATFHATSGPYAAGLYEKHDLDALLAAGHEVGSHTHSHSKSALSPLETSNAMSCRTSPPSRDWHRASGSRASRIHSDQRTFERNGA